MDQSRTKRIIIIVGIIIALLALGGGGYYWYSQSQNDSITTSSNNATPTATVDTTDEEIDWDALPTTEVTLADSTYVVAEAGTDILRGKTSGGIGVSKGS
ncbi:MAG TPA: hypothetical protein PKD68_05135, partial [Candidatus Saccharibacteria bacterium]|nr:hypothetical protein [Candidatus Saccharibacteria bacterium]